MRRNPSCSGLAIRLKHCCLAAAARSGSSAAPPAPSTGAGSTASGSSARTPPSAAEGAAPSIASPVSRIPAPAGDGALPGPAWDQLPRAIRNVIFGSERVAAAESEARRAREASEAAAQAAREKAQRDQQNKLNALNQGFDAERHSRFREGVSRRVRQLSQHRRPRQLPLTVPWVAARSRLDPKWRTYYAELAAAPDPAAGRGDEVDDDAALHDAALTTVPATADVAAGGAPLTASGPPGPSAGMDDDDRPMDGPSLFEHEPTHGALSQLNVAVADDVDVNGFTSKYGVTTSMLHAASKTDFPVVNWLRNNGAFFVGKLKCATPFAKADCVEFAPDVAAAAVACGSCDFAICSSMVGPAAIAAPISRDVVAFSPTESSLPHATPPFSRRRSIGFVTRRFETMDHVWDVMTGADAATVARARKMHVQFGNEEGVYVGRKADADDFAVVNDYIPGPVPPVKVGVPVKWIDKVLEKPGAGLAMLDALETRQRLRAPQKDEADDDDIDGRLDVSSPAARRATVQRFFVGTGKWVRKRLPPGLKDRLFQNEPEPRRKPTVSTSLQFDPVTVGWDIRHIVDVATTIADYELYRAMSQRSLEGSGVLEQLPVDTVSSIFHGKRITDAQYDRAKLAVEAFRREFAEEMTAVDSFSVPLLCPPFQAGNLRSLALALPFSLIGCPMCSLRLPLTYPSWTYRHTRRPRSEQDSTAGGGAEGSFLSSVWSSPSVLNHCVPIGDVSVAALDEGASARRGLRITGTRERNPQLPLLVVAEPGQDSTLREVTHAMLYTD